MFNSNFYSMKKLTKEEFIIRSQKIHNNKYDYSKVEYKNRNTKVCIICPIHGEFWQTPAGHLSGRGCSKCGHEKTNASKVITTEIFIQRAKNKHGDKYLYDKTIYSGFDKNVIITCPKHGDFVINAHAHISNGYGCPVCGQINKGPARLTTEQFIAKARKIHGDKYDYSKVNYTLANQKICIICPEHGEFWMTPNKHLIGEKCPKCSQSRGEEFIYRILSCLNINFEKEFTIKIKTLNRSSFRLDFAVNIQNVWYLIEYNGIQHYQSCEYFGGEEKFKEQQIRDQDLRDFVQTNSTKYKLLEIDYRYNKQTTVNKILNFLNVPINSNINSKLGELLEGWNANQQPSISLTTNEGSETNTWNCNTEYNSNTSAQLPI